MEFNILKEPWIRVLTKENKEKEVSLLEFFKDAHHYKDILPIHHLEITSYVIYRFVTVFVMDAYQIQTPEDIIKQLKTGHFDENLIFQYIKKCEKENVSFDLLDDKRPFMQTGKDLFEKYQDHKRELPVSKLCNVFPAGNNAVFFHPEMQREEKNCEDSYDLSFQEYLICLLLFLTESSFSGGGGSGGYSPHPSFHKNYYPYFILNKGENVFRTIFLSMAIRRNNHYDEVIPIWRRESYLCNLKEEVKKGHSDDFMLYAFYPNVFIRYKNIENNRVVSIEIIPVNATKDFNTEKCGKPSDYNESAILSDPHVFYKTIDGKDGKKLTPFAPNPDKTRLDDLSNIVSSGIESRYRESFSNKQLSDLLKELKKRRVLLKDESYSLVLYYMNIQTHANALCNMQGKKEYELPISFLDEDNYKLDSVTKLILYAEKSSFFLGKKIMEFWDKKDGFSLANNAKRNFCNDVALFIQEDGIPKINQAKTADELEEIISSSIKIIREKCICVFKRTCSKPNNLIKVKRIENMLSGYLFNQERKLKNE